MHTAASIAAKPVRCKVSMLDILELRIQPEELEQLRQCQALPRSDSQAAFTVKGAKTIWAGAYWANTAAEQRVNVRGWFPLLDKIADEFLIWRPQGGCFFLTHEGARYRLSEDHRPGVEFLLFELSRPVVVTSWQPVEARTA